VVKHKDGFLHMKNLTFIKGLAFAGTLGCFVLVQSNIAAYAESPGTSCVLVAQSQSDNVFNQALETVSTLSNSAVKSAKRGAWRPDGSFRKRFFAQAGSSLSTIRALLAPPSSSISECMSSGSGVCSANMVPKTELLAAFDQIFALSFPKGLQSLRRLQSSERAKFEQTVDALPDNYITCK
jgi:hypothetical protein